MAKPFWFQQSTKAERLEKGRTDDIATAKFERSKKIARKQKLSRRKNRRAK